MYKESIVCYCYVCCIYCLVYIFVQDFFIVGRMGDIGICLVFGIDKVSFFKGFYLVVFYFCVMDKFWVQFIVFGMSDDKIYIGFVYLVGK